MPTAAQSQAGSFFLDEHGNVQRKNTRGEYGFANFYQNRHELNAGTPVNYDWLTMNRPDILRGDRGKLRRPLQGRFAQVDRDSVEPRDWGQGGESGPPDISGISNVRPSPTPTSPLGIGGRSGYNLYNARTVEPPGMGMESGSAAPSQSFAGGGGGWEPFSGSVGTGRATLGTGQGAMPPGTQFSSMGAGVGMVPGMTTGPRPIAAIGPGPVASSTTQRGTFNPRRPGMSGSALGKIRDDLSDI